MLPVLSMSLIGVWKACKQPPCYKYAVLQKDPLSSSFFRPFPRSAFHLRPSPTVVLYVPPSSDSLNVLCMFCTIPTWVLYRESTTTNAQAVPKTFSTSLYCVLPRALGEEGSSEATSSTALCEHSTTIQRLTIQKNI